ncbi:MAG: hypothetical protein SGARI_006773 [Bacillariaceae sp.]
MALGSHWILAAICLAQKRIQIYDSLGRRYPNILVKLKKYLRMEYRNKKQSAMPAPHEWELDESTAATPRQTNGKLGIVCLLPWQLLLKQESRGITKTRTLVVFWKRICSGFGTLDTKTQTLTQSCLYKLGESRKT